MKKSKVIYSESGHGCPDPRHILNGREIPTEYYCDQPYVVQADDGAWVCVLTTGTGVEGTPGQYVATLRSADQGHTWKDQGRLEPAGGPEASYAVLLKVPTGRIYCFYNHNTDNIRQVRADNPPFSDGFCRRVDSLGHFVFKYSDDHGKTWSDKRYELPVREMEIDRQNVYGGKLRFFWNVGKAFCHDGAGYVPLHKVGGFGHGFFTRSEGVLLKSANILSEQDPEQLNWETLPDGDAGLRTPPGGGLIAEEQSFSVLSDGSFYCVYRTIDGHPTEVYSRDGGHTWTQPRYKCFADGRRMRHPRAATFAWKCSNGRFLYWFHNHGGKWYDDRNPVWLCGGVEADTPEGKIIRWTQPEILLYDDDPYIRMSYPDLIEEDGAFFITETQKYIARVHLMDPSLLQGLWSQFDANEIATEGRILSLPAEDGPLPSSVAMPRLPEFLARDNQRADHGTCDFRTGFTLDVWLRFESLEPGQLVLDTRTETGEGLCLRTSNHHALELSLSDGRCENRWCTDSDVMEAGRLQHVVAIVDAGPKIISFVVDGVLCDGAGKRQFGWGRFSPTLRHANGAETLRIGGPTLRGSLVALRLYDRYLRISEAIANWRAGCPTAPETTG